MIPSMLRRLSYLFLAALFSSLTAHAEAPQGSEVVYMGDIEGRLTQLTSFLDGSGAFERRGSAWDLKPGKTLVFSGDVIDRGPHGREVLRILLDLKERFPDRVVFTLGNRDIIKLALPPELSEKNMKTSIPPYDEWMAEKHLDPRVFRGDRATKLQWLLSAVGAKRAFEDLRTELKREGKTGTDAEVVETYLADLKSGGLMARYLQKAQLAHLDEASGTIFVHGAANDANIGRLPEHPRVRMKQVKAWVKELNRWSSAEIANGLAHPDPAVNGAQKLVDSIFRDPTTHKNDDSIVTARYFDEHGSPQMPSREFIASLKSQGVRRIAVGHTPTGEIPLVMIEDGFEIVMADQSFSSHAKSASIRIGPNGVKMISELPGLGQVYVDTENGIPEHVGRKLPSGELVAGRLANGDVVLFMKDKTFQPIYRTVTPATVRRLMKPSSCSLLFR